MLQTEHSPLDPPRPSADRKLLPPMLMLLLPPLARICVMPPVPLPAVPSLKNWSPPLASAFV